MNQTRFGSFVEAVINTIIGFAINYCANLIILPMFGMKISLINNFYMGILYTMISVIRSYAIRRYFNNNLQRSAYYLSKILYKE